MNITAKHPYFNPTSLFFSLEMLKFPLIKSIVDLLAFLKKVLRVSIANIETVAPRYEEGFKILIFFVVVFNYMVM